MKKIIGFLSLAVVLTAISCNNETEKKEQSKEVKKENVIEVQARIHEVRSVHLLRGHDAGGKCLGESGTRRHAAGKHRRPAKEG